MLNSFLHHNLNMKIRHAPKITKPYKVNLFLPMRFTYIFRESDTINPFRSSSQMPVRKAP